MTSVSDSVSISDTVASPPPSQPDPRCDKLQQEIAVVEEKLKLLEEMYAEKCQEYVSISRAVGNGTYQGGNNTRQAAPQAVYGQPAPAASGYTAPVAQSIGGSVTNLSHQAEAPVKEAPLLPDPSSLAPVGGLVCKVCGITATGEFSMAQHLAGDRHRKNLARYNLSQQMGGRPRDGANALQTI